MKDKPQNWKKIFAKVTSDKELLSKIYKEFLKINNKKTNNPNILTDTSPKIYIHGKKPMKRCSTSYVIREMQIKTTLRCNYTHIRKR